MNTGKKVVAVILFTTYLTALNPSILLAGEWFRPIAADAAFSDPLPESVAAENAVAVAAPVRGAEASATHGPRAVAASASALISAAEGGSIRVGGLEISFPAGALETDTEISVTRLPATHETGDELANVTSGGGGWRFLPAGATFKADVTIRMPYDAALSVNETALSNLYTYFYDTEAKKWVKLPRTGIDREHARVESVTTHFTDMINGTLSMPEGPKPLSFNLNSIKNLEAANPGAGIPKVEGLEAGPMGDASFRLALETPAGRAGMRPQLALSYSSGGGSGLCGKGFDVQAGGSVRIDTTLGLPRYEGTDTYKLDGAKLVRTGVSGTTTQYRREGESSFDLIEHHAEPGNDRWTVRSRNGGFRTYGSVAWTGLDAARKFAWYLEREEDSRGNVIEYAYYPRTGDGDVYLKSIRYAGFRAGATTAPGPYLVRFEYAGRADARVDGRGRFIVARDKRLVKVSMYHDPVATDDDDIEANRGTEIRSYEFDNDHKNAFGQTVLAAFSETRVDSGGVKRTLFSYGFDYEDLENRGTAEAPLYDYFEEQAEWHPEGGLQVAREVGSGVNLSVSGGVGIGK